MIIEAFLNTFLPEILDLGGLTTNLDCGSNAILGIFLVIIGESLDFKGAAISFKIRGVINGTKFVVGISLGVISAALDKNIKEALKKISLIESFLFICSRYANCNYLPLLIHPLASVANVSTQQIAALL